MTGIVSTLWAIYLAAAGPAATVEVEIFIEPRAPITAAQEWLGELALAGLTHVRIRAKQHSDQVGIEVRGPETQPAYRITGMINSGNELVLPSGRYRLSQARLAVRWIEEVAQKGPAQKTDTEETRAPMGLSAGQLQKLRQSLAQPVAAPTSARVRRATPGHEPQRTPKMRALAAMRIAIWARPVKKMPATLPPRICAGWVGVVRRRGNVPQSRSARMLRPPLLTVNIRNMMAMLGAI